MTHISTYVFFDIETTGLPREEGNQTKIVEACFIAVSNKDLKSTPYRQKPAMSRLIVQLNPERPIQSGASALHGITNTFLKHSPTFASKIETIKAFLEDLKKPLCLIAHNGFAFDFPILLAEWFEVETSISAGYLCVDSLAGFRTLLKNSNVSHLTLSCQNSEDEVIEEEEEEAGSEESEESEGGGYYSEIEDIFSFANPRPAKKLKIAEKPRAVFQSSFRLTSVYERLINDEIIGAHSAEGDCIMLLKCVIAIKEMFLPWARKNCKYLYKVKPLR